MSGITICTCSKDSPTGYCQGDAGCKWNQPRPVYVRPVFGGQDILRKKVNERIEYLRLEEGKAIVELDGLLPGTVERDLQWRLIRELCARRGELECILLSNDV